MLLAIIFGSIFLTVIFALTGYVLVENKLQTSDTNKTKALSIAEAGVEYYKWHLAHFPNDLQNGTGAAGPYTITYNDPEGASAGTILLKITGNNACGLSTSIQLESKGTPNGSTKSATVYARYARPTVAQYSYVINDSVWAGSDRVINGPYHSNGGIRMDGTANAPVTSSLSTWSCTSSYGCSPTATKAGVWGAGPNQTLWSYPKPQVDFSAITADFSSLKTTAQAQGIYFARYSNGNGGVSFYKGYHLKFKSDGTVDVYRVGSEYNNTIYAAADQNQITISNTGKTTVVRKVQSYNPATPDFIEFGGDCYASTYPFNQIEVKAYYNGGLVGLTAGDIISLHSSSMVPRCVNGRYDFAIRGDRLPAGASGNSYRIEVALVGVDANGAQFRNTGTGLFNVTLQRVP
jgi:hypothetical protein